MVNLQDITTFTIVTGSGLLIIYSFLSSIIVMTALRRISGKELKRLLLVLFFTLFSGFIYSIWFLLYKFDILTFGRKFFNEFLNNILLMLFIVLVVYLSFLARDISKKFGFKLAAKDIQARIADRLKPK